MMSFTVIAQVQPYDIETLLVQRLR